MASPNSEIIYHSFNQDLNYFLIGTKEGCTIYQTDPFKKGFNLSKFSSIIIIILLYKKKDLKVNSQ